ncbi:MAG: tRNA (guanosine(46)-N7)-methyltransferase TrmB [Syntrophobacterales bacterium]|nr:MAG: tRNA (guanosine(46)-N7)-methyltransferase TrmB [Syntrophobacterales bacterium]
MGPSSRENTPMDPRNLSRKPLIPWLQAERPIDWKRQFGRKAILEVEIGFGYGEFLVTLAQTHPEWNFVGLEVKWASIQKTLRNIAHAKVCNVRLIQAEARVAFDRLFLPQSLHRIYALFPDPWPKKRHVKHRLFSHVFLKLLNSRLICGGEVRIITDDEPYSNWILEQASGTGFQAFGELIPPRFGTKYERKWHESGQKEFYELQLLKQEHVEIPLKEDIPLKTYHIEHFDPDRFQPSNERGKNVIEFKEFLYDIKHRKGMVQVVVAEANLTQNFWIEIGQDRKGWYIRVGKGCGVVPTTGVQRALDLVRDAAHQ